jgi:hypothetical protein
MQKLKLLFFICIFFSVSSIIYAVEYRRFGQDVRSLAMGNTGIASANSSAALYYNPAVMANILEWWVDLTPITVSYSDDAAELYKSISSGGLDLNSQEKQLEFMQDFIGENPYVHLAFSPSIYANISKMGFTMGATSLDELILDVKVRNPSMPEINAFTRLDKIKQTGVSFPMSKGTFILGATAKSIGRQEINISYGMADVINGTEFPTLSNSAKKGTGTGYDFGILYRPPSPYNLMFGAVYKSEVLLGDATKVPGEVAVGVASRQEIGEIFHLLGAMDFRDLTYQAGSVDDRSLNRRTHLGLELGIFPRTKTSSHINVRWGYNQGYTTKGAELNMGHSMILGYAEYTEETGEYAGHSGSPRTMYYISFGF